LLKLKPELEIAWVNGDTLREFASVQCICIVSRTSRSLWRTRCSQSGRDCNPNAM
jgi:hypothetical protein